MKKFLLIALTALFCVSASAQVTRSNTRAKTGKAKTTQTFPKNRFGFQTGIGLATWVGGDVSGVDPKFAWNDKFIWEHTLKEKTYLMAGIGFDFWGEKYAATPFTDAFTCNTFYLTLPIHLGYRVPFKVSGLNFHAFGDAGPQFAIGLAGSEGHFDGSRRFDLGLGFRIGAEYNKMQFFVGLNGGLVPTISGVNAHNFDFAYFW